MYKERGLTLTSINFKHLKNQKAGVMYIENNTWQNLYHTPYQPETPISARGFGLTMKLLSTGETNDII